MGVKRKEEGFGDGLKILRSCYYGLYMLAFLVQFSISFFFFHGESVC
jgi:hypothetical protein